MLIFCSCSNSNQIINQFGTSIAIATGKDGIVLAADSRITFAVTSDSLIGYLDSCQKILNVKGYPIAAAGSRDFFTIDSMGKDMLDIVDDYNSLDIKNHQNPVENVVNFVTYMVKQYPHPKLEPVFFSGGYINDSAKLIFGTYKKVTSASVNYTSTSYKLDSILKIHYRLTTCDILSLILQKSITEYIKKFQPKKSGGPIQIIKIKKDNTFEYIKNDFTNYPYWLKKMKLFNS
jgi:hypothetical protein